VVEGGDIHILGVSMGRWSSRGISADREARVRAAIAVTGRDEPDPSWVEAYDTLYPRYRELYAALKPTFDALSSGA
jgi:sugar (pentulose or hexulose) kinase